jgi:hypothetical protein
MRIGTRKRSYVRKISPKKRNIRKTSSKKRAAWGSKKVTKKDIKWLRDNLGSEAEYYINQKD